MAKVEKPIAEIVGAAQALEDELLRLEAMSRSARKIPLNSEKNLTRAAAELGETVALPERLAQRLQAVAAALGDMQARQQAALEPLAARAVELQQRLQLFGEHMQSFAALGQAAAEANALLTTDEGDRPDTAQVEARLHEISEAARALCTAARADDFPEIAHEADVLKQRMTALNKRLGDLPAGPAVKKIWS